jgi:hypothetical protein
MSFIFNSVTELCAKGFSPCRVQVDVFIFQKPIVGIFNGGANREALNSPDIAT